jgi:uncharacterized protein (DUF697 family)
VIKLKGTLGVRSLLRAAREVRELDEWHPIVVAGAPALVPLLVKQLTAGGEAGAVREGGPVEQAAALLYVLGAPSPDAEALELLRAADRARVPIVCLAQPGVDEVPYVLAEDIVHVGPGGGFPLDEIAQALARRLGDDAVALARRLPALRRAVCEELIRSYSRRNGLIGAAVFVPGLDMPILTLNQIRLVLRIAYVYGHGPDRERLAELLPVIGTGFAFRALARELLDLVPVGGWLLKGGVAYAGTRAIGEAAVRYFEAGGARALADRVP